jgi:hypothetical protein
MKAGKYLIVFVLICFSFLQCKQANHIEKQTTLEDSLFKGLVKKYNNIPHLALGGNNSFENIYRHLSCLTNYNYTDTVQVDFYDVRPDMVHYEFPMVKLTYNKKAFLIPYNLATGNFRRYNDTISRVHESFNNEMSNFIAYYNSYYKKDNGREKRTLDLLNLLLINSLKAEEFHEADTLLLSDDMIQFISKNLTITEPEKQKEVYNNLKKRVSLFITDYNKNFDFIRRVENNKFDCCATNSNNKIVIYYKIFNDFYSYSFLKVTIQGSTIEGEYFNLFYNHILHI